MKDDLKGFIDESQFDVDELLGLTSKQVESSRQSGVHELHESDIVSPESLNNRRMRIGNTLSLESMENVEESNIESDMKQKGIQPVKEKTKKQDLVLRKKKTSSGMQIGQSFIDTDTEDIKNVQDDYSEVVSVTRQKKDLKLAKSKFSETKEEEYSWSLEALGVNGKNQKSSKTSQTQKTSKKKKEKEPGEVPVFKILLAVIMFVAVIGFAVMQKSGKNFGFLSGKDMHPALTESSFYISKKVEDYSTLKYMDIVLYEVGGEMIPSRLIGFPGDSVMVRPEGVYLNDELIDPKLIGGEFDFYETIENAPDDYKYNNGNEDYLFFKLPKDGSFVFLLGDNHNNARDSLTYGPIDITLIKEVIDK